MFEIGSSLREARTRQGLTFEEMEARTKVRAKYLRLLEERRHEMQIGDALRAADMAHRVLYSVFDQSVQFADRPPGPVTMSHEQLVDEVVRAVLGYLGHRGAGGAP